MIRSAYGAGRKAKAMQALCSLMARRIVLFILVLAASACSSIDNWRKNSGARDQDMNASAGASAAAPKMDAKRKVAEQDCSKPIVLDQGNLRCK
jgi:hypothetical protein